MTGYLSVLPDVIGPSTIRPINRRPRLMTPVWGTLRTSFSGISWHCAQAAINEGVIERAFVLESKRNIRLQASGALWKLTRYAMRRKIGGFKVTQSFSDLLWARYLPLLDNTVIINNMQIFGDYFLRNYRRRNITPCFYIDGTLSEYYDGYRQVEEFTIGDDVMARAVQMECESYQHASHIFTMSQTTAQNLTGVYGVPSNRVTMVLPGANMDDAAVPAPSQHKGWVGDEFTLGFVGLFPLRKGLDKLAGAVDILRSRDVPIRLRVIGRCPDDIAAMDGVEFLGMISKATDLARFIEAIRTVDLGCQLSRAELLGIAILEFMRVGVPILATNVGGVPDVLAGGGGVLVRVDITPEQLAEELYSLMTDGNRYQVIRQAAIRRSEWASWRRTAWELDKVLPT